MSQTTPELELHPVQTKVLHQLLFCTDASFAELVPAEMTSDHFNFHLKRLVEIGLVEKRSTGRYALSIAGKEFTNRYDTDHKVIERQGKVAVLLLVSREVEGVQQYLIQRRVKQPYFGFYGRPTGKLKWGETVLEGAARELLEETGLSAGLEVIGMQHKVDRSPEGKLLEDKYFFVVRGSNPEGELRAVFEGGENYWMTAEQIQELTQTFGSLLEGFIVGSTPTTLFFTETAYQADQY